MLFRTSCCAHAIVTHVVSIALHANLQVRIAVNFCYIIRRYACLTVQAINVLAYYLREDASIHELSHSHMSDRWLGLLDRHVKWHAMSIWQRLSFPAQIFFVLLSQGSFLPAAWACLQDSAVS